MADSVEKFGQINVYHVPVTRSDILQRAAYRIVLATVRTESETGLRKVRLPNLRYHLSYRRLNKAIQDSRYPEQTNPAFRLVYFLSPDRQWFVPSFHYGGLFLRPMLLKVSAELAHGHPVHSRRTFVAAHLPERTPQIVPLQNLL